VANALEKKDLPLMMLHSKTPIVRLSEDVKNAERLAIYSRLKSNVLSVEQT